MRQFQMVCAHFVELAIQPFHAHVIHIRLIYCLNSIEIENGIELLIFACLFVSLFILLVIDIQWHTFTSMHTQACKQTTIERWNE